MSGDSHTLLSASAQWALGELTATDSTETNLLAVHFREYCPHVLSNGLLAIASSSMSMHSHAVNQFSTCLS